MNQEDIKQMVERLRNVAERNAIMENTSLYSASADMIESLRNQLADCQRELEAERERRFEGNRISSEEHAAELEEYKALCDQIGNVLEVSSPLYRENDIDWHDALEAWRAMK